MSTRKTDLQRQLELQIDAAPWDWLAPHAQRGALWIVSPELPLVMAAMALEGDFIDDVRGWLEAGQLSRPSADQIAIWDEVNQPFQVLIVQPYVLATPIPVQPES